MSKRGFCAGISDARWEQERSIGRDRLGVCNIGWMIPQGIGASRPQINESEEEGRQGRRKVDAGEIDLPRGVLCDSIDGPDLVLAYGDRGIRSDVKFLDGRDGENDVSFQSSKEGMTHQHEPTAQCE